MNATSCGLGFIASALIPGVALSADLLIDPTPVAQQPAPNQPAVAVDAVNFELSILGGAYQRNVLGTASNAMFTASVASPIPNFTNFGIQIDGAAGIYDGDFYKCCRRSSHLLSKRERCSWYLW